MLLYRSGVGTGANLCSNENCESTDGARVHPMPSEKVSDEVRPWHRLGGVLEFIVTVPLFSLSFVRLIMFLMRSFWAFRWS